MISIGEFSKICSVTTKTLRFYDEKNILKPKHVAENGYRYYDIDQLKTMLFINKLKGYGFSLEEIKDVMFNKSESFLIKKLTTKEQELKSKIEDYNYMINKVNDDVNNLKRGVSIMAFLDNFEVELVEKGNMNILYTRQYMSVNDYGKYIGKLFETIAKEKLTIQGNLMSIYHDKEFDPQNTEIEIAVPVKEPVKGTRDYNPGLCAHIVHKGPYSELSNCYAKLTEWIETNNYSISSPPFEIYMTDINKTKPEDHITEIYFPVKHN